MRRRIFRNLKKLILASQSPRRKELLEQLGIAFSVNPAKLKEPPPEGVSPERYALKLANLKAKEVLSRLQEECFVLAADTIVVCEGKILGKPKDYLHAKEMLELLSGRAHEVYTAYALFGPQGQRENIVKTEVYFKKLAEKEILAYLNTEEPWDKAGAYAIQGMASYMVERVAGSVTNVIGLPLKEVVEDLLALKVITFYENDRE
ncbi:Maf family protein [Thermodesulfatator atlanticus]